MSHNEIKLTVKKSKVAGHHMGSNSVTSHQKQVMISRLNSSQTGFGRETPMTIWLTDSCKKFISN